MELKNQRSNTVGLLFFMSIAWRWVNSQKSGLLFQPSFKFLVCGWLFFLLSSGLMTVSHGMAVSLFRVGFLHDMFTDVNDNDARAAIKVWGDQVARGQNVPIQTVPLVFSDIGKMLNSLVEKKVDIVAATVIEYQQLQQKLAISPIFVTYIFGNIEESYVLLAHRKGAVKSISDLSGRSLVIYTNPRACLASMWLDILLFENGHPTAKNFVGKIFGEVKLAQVILPVFFRQRDACVVTHSAFNMMSQLNPQLASKLIIIAESVEIVPCIFGFRADYNPVFKEKIINGLKQLNSSPAGQQLMTIFQSDDIKEIPASCLDPALELITTHKKLIKQDVSP